MTRAGQMQAHRPSTRQSSAPRTPKDKAVIAHRPVKHGLWEEPILVAGKGRARCERQRFGMRRSLVLGGEVEVTLGMLLRQTNPIPPGAETGQVLSEAGVTDDSVADSRAETKPISESFKFEVSSWRSR